MGQGSLGVATQPPKGLGTVEAIGPQAGARFGFQLGLQGFANHHQALPALAPVEALNPPLVIGPPGGRGNGLEPVRQSGPVLRLDQRLHGLGEGLGPALGIDLGGWGAAWVGG